MQVRVWVEADDVWEAVNKTQEACTCDGAPHDDDCAIVKEIFSEAGVQYVPRWAEAPKTKPYKGRPAYTAPYKDGKMIHDDKESS